MTLIRRTTPVTFRQAFDRLFDESAFRPIARSQSTPAQLPVDISSTDEVVTVEAALAGIHPDDVQLTVHEDALTIAVKDVEKNESDSTERTYREVRRSHGSRTLRLPKGLDIDAAAATFENGLLKLSIPRAEEAKPRQIPVTAVTEASAAMAAGQVSTEAPQEGAEQA
jgi:HSP20 family protein